MVPAVIQQIEALLKTRRLDGLVTTATTARDMGSGTAPTGLATLDVALGGGWRRGAVSELIGPRSSGRTSLLLATLAAATARGEIVGLVDACDRLDPEAATAAGLDLPRTLWVRGADLTIETARAPMVDLVLRRALRAFDLVLRAGGFGVVALDVADIPARVLRRLPMTTWLRLAQANEGRDTVALVIGEAPMGRSARGVSMRLSAEPRWAGTSDRSRRLAGLDLRAAMASAHIGVGRDVALSL